MNCLAPAPAAPPTPATVEQKSRMDELVGNLELDSAKFVKMFPPAANPDKITSTEAQAIIAKLEAMLDALLSTPPTGGADDVPW
jgi:hypothetical protein